MALNKIYDSPDQVGKHVTMVDKSCYSDIDDDNELIEVFMDSNLRRKKGIEVEEPGTIDLLITGDNDIINYLNDPKQKALGSKKIYLWGILVQRLPIIMLANESVDNNMVSYKDFYVDGQMYSEDIASFPKGTTLHHYVDQLFSQDARRNKKHLPDIDGYYKDSMPDGELANEDVEETTEDKEKRQYRYNLSIQPQENFEDIDKSIYKKSNEIKLGFNTSRSRSRLKRVSRVHPPMEAIPFTCFFSKENDFQDEITRSRINELLLAVNESVLELYDYDFFKYTNEGTLKKEATGLGDKVYSRLRDIEKKLSENVPSNIEEDNFIFSNKTEVRNNLKWMSIYRIWSFDFLREVEGKQKRKLKEASPDPEKLRVFSNRKKRWESNKSNAQNDLEHSGPIGLRLQQEITKEGSLLRHANADWEEERIKRLEKQAKLAAIAQVFARTTSHNTGSHILAHNYNLYSEAETNLEEIRDPDKFRGLIQSREKGLNDFLEYLRERMLFNADISMANPSSSLNYKLVEITKKFERLDLIRKRITGIKGKHFKQFIGSSKFGITVDDAGDEDLDLDPFTLETQVALPNGVLGRQAFFLIFENLIRNFFKHSSKGEFLYQDNLYLMLSRDEANDIGDHLSFLVWDGSEITGAQVNHIIKCINESILRSDNNRLRNYGLGFIEVKAAIGYLNGLLLENIDEFKIGGRQILEVDLPETKLDKHQNGYSKIADAYLDDHFDLKFRFFLTRPRVLAFVENEAQVGGDYGPGIVSSSQIEKLRHYEYLVITSNACAKELLEIRCSVTPFLYFAEGLDKSIVSTNKYPIIDNKSIALLKKAELSIDEKLQKLQEIWINAHIPRELANPDIFYTMGNSLESHLFTGKVREGGRESEGSERYLFDDHGYNLKSISNAYSLCFELSKNSRFGIKFDKYKKSSEGADRQYFYNEIVLMANARILVLDERIQSKAIDSLKLGGEGKLDDISKYKLGNVFIPEEAELKLNLDRIEKSIGDFEMDLKDYLSQFENKFDFIVIHLGIVEKCLNKDKGDSDSIKKWVSDHLQKSSKNERLDRVVMISDRGTPTNVPISCRFLHYSNVSYSLINENKYVFHQTLLNSRSVQG